MQIGLNEVVRKMWWLLEAEDQWGMKVTGIEKMPEDVLNKLKSAFPGGPMELIKSVSGGMCSDLHLVWEHQYQEFEMIMEVAAKMREFEVRWEVPHDTLYITSIYVGKEHMYQGHNRKIMAGLHDFCKRLKIGSMTLKTADDGHHVWARVGFMPSGSESDLEYLRGVYAENVEKLKEEGSWRQHADKLEVVRSMMLAGKFSFWEIADSAIGMLVMDEHWAGELNFGSARQVKRLEDYCRGAKKKSQIDDILGIK